ncbi:MAG: sugar ABC transporter permease [Actinomycetota bacterium]|nr:sugar ABC transporter permease [Actinomycetota bacterium]
MSDELVPEVVGKPAVAGAVAEASPVPPVSPERAAFRGVSGTKRTTKGWFLDTGWRHLVGLAVVVFALFPVLWVLSAAFSTTGLNSQSMVPEEVSLDNFRALMTDDNHPPFLTWMRNSMLVGAITSIVTVFLCALAAYAFSRLRFKGRRPGMTFLLLVQMFPNLLALTALFLFMDRVAKSFPAFGLGTTWGLILIYLGGALGVNTWLMKGFFDSIPRELDEAAKVDGATHAQIFFKVILPLAAPVLAVIALLSFVASQSEFIIADVILGQNDQQRTAAVGLSRFILAGFDSRWGPFAAGSLIVALPVVILWLFLQRFVVTGLTAGAVKG